MDGSGDKEKTGRMMEREAKWLETEHLGWRLVRAIRYTEWNEYKSNQENSDSMKDAVRRAEEEIKDRALDYPDGAITIISPWGNLRKFNGKWDIVSEDGRR